MVLVNGLEIVPDNSVLCIEEHEGNIKSIYGINVASEKARAGIPVNYLTIQTKEEVLKKMTQLRIPHSDLLHIIEVQLASAKHEVLALINQPGAPFMIIDQFAVFFAEDSFSDLRHLLSRLITISRKGTTFLILLDCGVLPERHEHLVRAMADGIIQFVVVPEGDKLKNYINIPKMRGTMPQDKMLPFTVTAGEGLLVDTRERHG